MRKYLLLGVALTVLFGANILISASAKAADVISVNDDPFEARDPFKSFNQSMFKFNVAADRYFIKPIQEQYHEIPDGGRKAVSNVVSNLREPANFVNGVLQLDPELAFTAFWRFLINSTVGLAGINDVASTGGLKQKPTNFGKTLGVYGFEEGSYIVLPLAGPSTVRDTVGSGVDLFIDPVSRVFTFAESAVRFGSSGISKRDDRDSLINNLYYESIEPYTATRSVYLQHEAFQ